tara:strand:- start:157 stop:285 length:129 start_codon:yes stop_codon:yes gene_type:complete
MENRNTGFYRKGMALVENVENLFILSVGLLSPPHTGVWICRG